ncbi:MAG TPA: VTT domain-containing protein [Burkholderiales bacterium]|nr:VTT domain-containing protein [Burkholderiales bacterium]
MASLLQPGSNCSAAARAARAAFLFGADEYYRAFRHAAERATRSIVIVGWDFDDRTALGRKTRGRGLLKLGEFLDRLVRKRPKLEVYVLAWDYGALYGSSGDGMRPLYGPSGHHHARVHLHYDSTNAAGCSHHQKLIVIDDAIAFCGGIDFTSRRAVDSRDAVAVVDAGAAHALGEIARERWSAATRQAIRTSRGAVDPWPQWLKPDVTDVEVGISRTLPAIDARPAVHEIERLFLDAIAKAERSIRIDTAHFTSERVAAALASRLAEDDPPEIVLVTRDASHGWLDRAALETRRARALGQVESADTRGRFRAYTREPTLGDAHTTVMVVDDSWLHVGSAGLSNRSLRYDSECDVTFEAGDDPRRAEALRALCDRVFGDVARLRPLTRGAAAPVAAPLEDAEPALALDDVIETFAPDTTIAEHATGPAWGKLALIAVGIAVLTAVWRYTPLSEVFTPERAIAWAEDVGAVWWAPLAVMAAYTPACFVMFPRPLITLFAVIAFGPALGLAYSLLGILGAALSTYFAGLLLPRDTVRKLAGDKLNEMTEVLRRRGLIAIFAVRIVPVAPFAVEGMVAGAVGIKLWHYALGTILGMLPGTLTTTVFGEQIKTALEDPSRINYWLVAGVGLFFVGVIWIVRRWFLKEHRLAEAAQRAAAQAAA